MATKQPNILILWGDDIGMWNLSYHSRGMMGYHTPNIDRIANEGVNSPTTIPSRAVPPDARASSPARTRSAPASLK
jgi:arylsulfatase A-like enzyme